MPKKKKEIKDDVSKSIPPIPDPVPPICTVCKRPAIGFVYVLQAMHLVKTDHEYVNNMPPEMRISNIIHKECIGGLKSD